jgi:hypothetical protein
MATSRTLEQCTLDRLERPLYKNGYFFTETLGGKPNVVRISKKHVARLSPDWDLVSNDKLREACLDRLEHLYGMYKELHGFGVSVPEPEGIFDVKVRRYFSEIVKPLVSLAFVREYIPGSMLSHVKKSDSLEVIKKWKDELTKARDLGFRTIDATISNVIWSPSKQKVYLIDSVLCKQSTAL